MNSTKNARLSGKNIQAYIYICYSPAGRSVLGETVPEVKVSGKFYFSLQPMCVDEGRVRVDVQSAIDCKPKHNIPALRTNQIAGFGGLRPLVSLKKNKSTLFPKVSNFSETLPNIFFFLFNMKRSRFLVNVTGVKLLWHLKPLSSILKKIPPKNSVQCSL